MKTRIEQTPESDYTPKMGDMFTTKVNNGRVFFCINQVQGAKGLEVGCDERFLYAVWLDYGQAGSLCRFDKRESEFIPLEPVNGELVFRVKK